MLTDRQQGLYNFLLEQHYFIFEDEIATDSGLYDSFFETCKSVQNFHDSPVRIAITKDIRAINESGEVEKIIISTPQGIKIASEEEYKEYIEREFKSIFKKLARTYKKAKKANLDGQINFDQEIAEVFAN